jgi:hypothetical protein
MVSTPKIYNQESRRMLSPGRIALGLLILTIGCSTTSPDEPWRMTLTTAGGLTGSGIGSYVFDSTGSIEIVAMSGARCLLSAAPDELTRMQRLVAAARDEPWRDSYAPEERCCDRIEYVLTLDTGGATRRVEWIDDPLPMPPALTGLSEALAGGRDSLRVKYADRCR